MIFYVQYELRWTVHDDDSCRFLGVEAEEPPGYEQFWELAKNRLDREDMPKDIAADGRYFVQLSEVTVRLAASVTKRLISPLLLIDSNRQKGWAAYAFGGCNLTSQITPLYGCKSRVARLYIQNPAGFTD